MSTDAVTRPATPATKYAKKPRRRSAPQPGMRSCAHCGRIYPARALLTPPWAEELRLCGTHALALAKRSEGARLSRFKAVARKAGYEDWIDAFHRCSP